MEPHHINNVLFSADDIKIRVSQLVEAIAADKPQEGFVLVGVLRGSFMFLADLVRDFNRHSMHPRIDFLTLESYGSGTVSSGQVRVTKDVAVDVTDAQVLLVDDILDSGRTLNFAINHLKNKGAKMVNTCTFLDKPDRRVVPIEADYVGFRIEDHFVVGYGLDYDSYYRELPYIAQVTMTSEVSNQ